MRCLFKLNTIAAVVVSALLITGCSTADMKTMMGDGSAMQTTEAKLTPTKASTVKLYYSNIGLPKHYKVIGRVSVDNFTFAGFDRSQQTIAENLREQAASIGGAGVINISTGLDQTTGDVIFLRH